MLEITDAVAAFGMSFGITALTVLSVRSEGNRKMLALTFLWTWAVITGIFAWADLPNDLAIEIAAVGAVLGLACVGILAVALRLEKRHAGS